MGTGVPPTTPARVIETHISVLVFVGDRVYKLRKPVRFGFLDFTDRRVREADCRREVELNRRLAPDVYLGVADIEMDGEPIDHMVVMRAPGDRPPSPTRRQRLPSKPPGRPISRKPVASSAPS
jgi:hypothetical protein